MLSEIYANRESAKLTGILDAFSLLSARVAQLVVHRTCNAEVARSCLAAGSIKMFILD